MTKGAALRPPDRVMSAEDLAGARATRHSFTRMLIRAAHAHGWRVNRARFDLDDLGRGIAVYEVSAESHLWSFCIFSQVIDEARRTDRVIAEAWDVTTALIDGRVSDRELDEMAPHVTRQEEGRAATGTLIWGRANRSSRFFNRVVEVLAEGRQPAPEMFGLSPYLLRSTAFYSNGKFGIQDFEGFGDDHPLAVPYRAHMLAAWLMREFSYDLVEHCARAVNPAAATLADEWSRYLGLGNATGLGLVPYVVNHPEVLARWVWTREYPLARALAQPDRGESAEAKQVYEHLAHLHAYLAGQGDLTAEPYSSGAEIARRLEPILSLVAEYRTHGTMGGELVELPWRHLHDAADHIDTEVRGVVASALIELTEQLDSEIERALWASEDRSVDPTMRLSDLRRLIDRHYGWVSAYDFSSADETDRFWFTSVHSEEPRRAVRGADPGEEVQHGIDVARMVAALRDDLAVLPGGESCGELLCTHPWHRAAVCRVQKVGPLRYGELRANLLSSAFVPLHPQRFQLTMYGMENFNPQSTDWLRVTLFSGAPRVAELGAGTVDDEWMFPLAPAPGRSTAKPMEMSA